MDFPILFGGTLTNNYLVKSCSCQQKNKMKKNKETYENLHQSKGCSNYV